MNSKFVYNIKKGLVVTPCPYVYRVSYRKYVRVIRVIVIGSPLSNKGHRGITASRPRPVAYVYDATTTEKGHTTQA